MPYKQYVVKFCKWDIFLSQWQSMGGDFWSVVLDAEWSVPATGLAVSGDSLCGMLDIIEMYDGQRVIIWLILWTKPVCSVSWLSGSTHPSLGWLSWRGSTRLPGQYLTDETRFWDIRVLISEELHVDLLGVRVYQLHPFYSCTPWE